MGMIEHSLIAPVHSIIAEFGKMAFVSGPRQVGKTTLAQHYRRRFSQSLYLNWDILSHQKKILTDPAFLEKQNREPGVPFLVVFDEIHKRTHWKNYLKGIYDQHREEFQFLVTGNGRLDLFRKGGDSLLGRHFSVQLLPLTLGELGGAFVSFANFKRGLNKPPADSPERRDAYQQLFRFGGFPEPFSRGRADFYNLWFAERKKLLVREDIRDANAIRNISQLEHATHLIPGRVGNPFSINGLREEVGVAFETARDWIALLEQFFYLFRVTPFSTPIARALRKTAKFYLFDWVEIEEDGIRFENLAAMHLLKAARSWQERGDKTLSLNFIRDKEKREVDFVLSDRGKPLCLVECKTSDEALSPNLVHFQRKLKAPVAIQLLHKSGVCQKRRTQGMTQWVVSADRWLALLP